jgi:hypothetical protein
MLGREVFEQKKCTKDILIEYRNLITENPWRGGVSIKGLKPGKNDYPKFLEKIAYWLFNNISDVDERDFDSSIVRDQLHKAIEPMLKDKDYDEWILYVVEKHNLNDIKLNDIVMAIAKDFYKLVAKKWDKMIKSYG